MFFHLQYIHLFRPFLKYTPTSSSPLLSRISPRQACTIHAEAIAKLMRLYKRTWGLRHICNIAVYMVHIACIIHLLNLPNKTAARNIVDGISHLEEIGEEWLCARRTLRIIGMMAAQWKCTLPDDAVIILKRSAEKFSGVQEKSTVPIESIETSSREIPPVPKSNGSNVYESMIQEAVSNAPLIDHRTAAIAPPNQIANDFNNPQLNMPPQAFSMPYQNSYIQSADIGVPMTAAGGFPDLMMNFPEQNLGIDNHDWFLYGNTSLHQNFGGWSADHEHMPHSASESVSPPEDQSRMGKTAGVGADAWVSHLQ